MIKLWRTKQHVGASCAIPTYLSDNGGVRMPRFLCLLFCFFCLQLINCQKNREASSKAEIKHISSRMSDTIYSNTDKNVNEFQLDSTDFIVGEFSTDIDTVILIQKLGRPASINISAHPFDEGSKIKLFRFDDLQVLFTESGCMGITLLSSKYSTKRGLTVGDSISKMIKLYGSDSEPYEGDYDFEDPKQSLHLIRVSTDSGVVKQIYLGYIFD